MKQKNLLITYTSVIFVTLFGSLLLQFFSGASTQKGVTSEWLLGGLIKYITIKPEIDLLGVPILLLIFILSLPVVWSIFFWKQIRLLNLIVLATALFLVMTIICMAAQWFGDPEWIELAAFALLLESFVVLALETLVISIVVKVKLRNIKTRL